MGAGDGDGPTTAPAALCDWVASVLLAAWERQEHEGRYRGADDFRALHIDPADALASWRATTLPATDWPPELRAWFAEWALDWPLADALGMDEADRLVAALALAVELEPRLRPLVAALGDDPTRPLPTVRLAIEVAGAVGLTAAQVRRACAPHGRLAWFDLVHGVSTAERPSVTDRALAVGPWLLDPDPVAAGAVAGDGGERVWHLHCADHVAHAEAAAAAVGCAGSVLTDPEDEAALGRAARDAAVGNAVLVVRLSTAPDAWLTDACERARAFGVAVATSAAPGLRWVPPPSWHDQRVAPLDAAARHRRWQARLPSAASGDLGVVAAELVLGAGDIDDAARRVATVGDTGLATLRAAARSTTWRDLTAVARPGPTGVGWDDLVVPRAVADQLREIARAIEQRSHVLDSWGFGARPGGRGYHLLLAGPSGTGKTLSAAVVAAEVGRELWVVDLARVVDKYLGETEKQLDRVLRAGEASGAILLFDEADALFGRRGEVHEARDRWANVEVAYLLQRIEDHDGVTVLTTNLGQNLDEAFGRRISQRVEFAVPDATLRRRLWRMSVPESAPVADELALVTVADRFELAGGAIRTAALNAAYEAATDRGAIDLGHLVRASVRELTKSGRPPTRGQLADLAPLLTEPVR